MAHLTQLKLEHKITIGVLIVFLGICIIASNYFNEKKFQVFDDMNSLWYEQLIVMEEELEEVELEELEEEPEEIIPEEEIREEVTTTTRKPAKKIDYTKYYVGYLSISKIDLRKGFTDINHRFNTVTRNIQVMKESDWPHVEKGNLIIAAHSGNSAVSFFKDLWRLKKGDEAVITHQGKDYKYVIRNIYHVPKTGKIPVRRNPNQTTLTLITCTRRDNTKQTVYIAELVR